MCGGYDQANISTCFNWCSGKWIESYTLKNQRFAHESWETESGVYIIGGYVSGNTTELLKKDGSVEEGFGLKYNTA